MDQATIQLANSLNQDEIPVKLRCASCNKLALNPFRLPCCDQSICGSCQSALPESCPVCSHSPLTPDDCKPNKTLRLTIKAFLKNEEKKREKDKAISVPLSTLLVHESIPAVAELPESLKTTPQAEAKDGKLEAKLENAEAKRQDEDVGSSNQDKTEPSNTDQSPKAVCTGEEKSENDTKNDEQISPTDHNSGQDGNLSSNKVISGGQDQEQRSAMNVNTGADGMMNGFQNTNWMNGNFNPMMAMPNMTMGGFPNMMSMSGMGMDPSMMSQGMFGGFNGQGMGMNGMNMGMGYDGGYGNWGSMSNMNGNFGANAGYYPNSGYNDPMHQGQFNGMQRQQRPHMNNFQQNRFQGQASNRGFGRDSGLRAGHVQSGQIPNQFEQNVQTSVQIQQIENHTPQTQGTSATTKQDSSRLEAEPGEQPTVSIEHDQSIKAGSEAPLTTESQTDVKQQSEGSAPVLSENSAPQPIAAFDPAADIVEANPSESYASAAFIPSGPAIPLGPAAQFAPMDYTGRGRGGWRGANRGRGRGGFIPNGVYGAFNGEQGMPIEPIGQGVTGAPTGPKALREGRPNTGFRGRGALNGLGRGSWAGGVAVGKPDAAQPSPTSAQRKSPAGTRSRSHSRSRSRTADEARVMQQRSIAGSANGHNSKTRSRPRSEHDFDEARPKDRIEELSSKRRSANELESNHRHSSRHDRDRSRGHRRRRHQSHSSEDDTRHSRRERGDSDTGHDDTNRERKRDDSRHRDRHAEKRSRRRSHRDRSRSPRDEGDRRASRAEQPDGRSAAGEKAQATGDAPREFKIHGRSKRSDLDIQKDIVREEKPDIDSHALEREARDRERLLKEQQRRGIQEIPTGPRGDRKRGRHEELVNGIGGDRKKLRYAEEGRRGKRGGHKYEDQENDEARAARIETEREGARWR